MSLQEAERAVRQLEEEVRRKASPGHHLARRVLLALGQVLGAEAATACAALLERTRAAGRAAGPTWRNAIQTELTLACGEFAQCLDPRYLDLPDYDLAYTRSARGRLADRLRAAGELGFQLTPQELRVLELADGVLAKVANRGGKQGNPPAPAREPADGEDRTTQNGAHN